MSVDKFGRYKNKFGKCLLELNDDGHLNVENKKIINVCNPTNDFDVTNKHYVDNHHEAIRKNIVLRLNEFKTFISENNDAIKNNVKNLKHELELLKSMYLNKSKDNHILKEFKENKTAD